MKATKSLRLVAALALAFLPLFFSSPAKANPLVNGDTIQFTYYWSAYELSFTDANVSIVVTNNITNKIGGNGEVIDSYRITVGDQVIQSTEKHDARTYNFQIAGTQTVRLEGIDNGYWGGFYGPIMQIIMDSNPSPSESSQVETESPSVTESPTISPELEPPTESATTSPQTESPLTESTPIFWDYVIDEGSSAQVIAPEGTVFSRVVARYVAHDSDCGIDVSDIVSAVLVGTNSATIYSDNGVFGDPCPGWYKKLVIEVEYSQAYVVNPTPSESEEASRLEAERIAAEQAAQAAAAEAARLEAERVAAEAARAEAARIAAEQAAAAEAARLEAERLEAARIEAERVAAAERAERERLERLAAEAEAARIEAERIAAEQAAELARIEAERAAAEEAAEAARLEAERLEAERIAAEAAAAAEAARLEAERLEAERIAAEKAAKEEAERIAALEKAKAEEQARLEAEEKAREEAEANKPVAEPEKPVEAPEITADAPVEELLEAVADIKPSELTSAQVEILSEAAVETLSTAEQGSEEYQQALEVLAVIAEADDEELPAELAAIPFIGDVAGAVLDVFNNVGNIGADMAPKQREKAEETVIAAVIVGQVAQVASAAAASASVAASSRKIK